MCNNDMKLFYPFIIEILQDRRAVCAFRRISLILSQDFAEVSLQSVFKDQEENDKTKN